RIAEQLHHPVVHLDYMHWEPGLYGIYRDMALRDEIVMASAEGDAWVMDGVYGQLAMHSYSGRSIQTRIVVRLRNMFTNC
ncbi:hypothetical protein ACC754_43300, partial [Rhizobium johnstonii]